MLCGLSNTLLRLSVSALNSPLKLQGRCFTASVKLPLQLAADGSLVGQQPQKKSKAPAPLKITLLTSGSDSVSVTTLEEAQHLSKRRDLKLVKIIDVDTKTQRPVYKLMSGAEFHDEDVKQREQRKQEKADLAIKGVKILMMNSGINQHDLDINIKKIVKWLAKKLEVRITINGDPEKSEKVYDSMDVALKSQARFLQKRVKDSNLKFQVIPPKNQDKNSSTS